MREAYVALMMTDTAFYRYPRYHTALDTPGGLPYPAMARLALGSALPARELAGGV